MLQLICPLGEKKREERNETTTTTGTSSEPVTTLRIAVGSGNPAKILAAKQAIQAVIANTVPSSHSKAAAETNNCEIKNLEFDIQGFDVDSGVPDQPFGDTETNQGARNRAKAAYAAFRKKNGRPPHLSVGMEGGLEWIAPLSTSSSSGDSISDNNGGKEASTTDLFELNAEELKLLLNHCCNNDNKKQIDAAELRSVACSLEEANNNDTGASSSSDKAGGSASGGSGDRRRDSGMIFYDDQIETPETRLAETLNSLSAHVANLRFQLVPSKLKESLFWEALFEILKERLVEYNAEMVLLQKQQQLPRIEEEEEEESQTPPPTTRTTATTKNTKEVLYCMAWMVVYGRRNAHVVDIFANPDISSYIGDKRPIFGEAKTASFAIPAPITKLILEGMELGDADDAVFGRINSKQGSGTVGILTNGLIDRSAYYEHALILALAPWMRPDVYSGEET